MGIKERKERERDQRRELILNAANEIVKKEGIDSLSIRKIANRIEYSPSIIYHYFRDKDDVLNHLMKRGYQKIVDGLSTVIAADYEPEQKLEKLMRKYIEVALQMPDEYKTVQLSSSPGILQYTASLFEGAADKKPALRILSQCLKEIYREEIYSDNFFELTAQIIASASFGLIIRLILEKDIISEEQREKLIEHHIKCVINGMVLGKPVHGELNSQNERG